MSMLKTALNTNIILHIWKLANIVHIRKLLHTKIPGTIIKFITNYIKGRKAYTIYRNHTSSRRKFKTGVPQGGVLSPTLFNIYTADIPPPRAPVQVMAYADDITITSTQARVQPRNTYIQFCLDKTKHSHTKSRKNNLHSVHPAEYQSNLDLKINNTALTMATHPKVLSFTLDPKLTYSQQLRTSSHATTYDQTLTATGWGKQKETRMATYKAVMRPAHLPYGGILHPRPALRNCKSCRIENCHRMHTRHKHTTSA